MTFDLEDGHVGDVEGEWDAERRGKGQGRDVGQRLDDVDAQAASQLLDQLGDEVANCGAEIFTSLTPFLNAGHIKVHYVKAEYESQI